MIINLNGVELDFDMTNVDFYEKYMENADDLDVAMNTELTDTEKEDYRKVVELFRDRCVAMKGFLDKLFGEGTGETVCGVKDDVEVCLDVYVAMCEGVAHDAQRLKKKFPGMNRAQRRAEKSK
ncbi:DUF6673 family protein [Faecalicatena contorta]|uniref:DUF6673 family protein n=1 Tax=Faecalicatena contorta TaxID=39482 RepID=UPI003217BF3A